MPIARCFINGCQWEQHRDSVDVAVKLRQRHEQVRHPDVYGAETNQPWESSRVEQLANVDWRSRAFAAARALAATGRDFTMYDLAEYGVEDPPDARTALGQFARDVHDLGIAHPVGYVKSNRPATKSSAVALWANDATRCATCKAKAAAA